MHQNWSILLQLSDTKDNVWFATGLQHNSNQLVISGS